MPDQYLLLLGVAVTVTLAVGFIVLLERLFHKLSSGKPSESVKTSVEHPPAWRRYHVHYYVYALLFLAFDMEMAFMYPWAVVYQEFGIEALVDMGIFLMVLFLGLLYAWSQKGLERP